MDKLIQMGKELGYEGQALQEFVKQQQDIERSERLAERELEKDKIAQVEKDREVELAKIAADREIEMARIESMERQAEKDREAKLAQIIGDKEAKLATEIELEKLKYSFERRHDDLKGQMNLQRAVFKVELEKQKAERKQRMRAIRNYRILTRVRIRWIVICQDLRNTRRQMSGRRVFGRRI